MPKTKKTEAVYVKVSKGKVVKSREINSSPLIIADYDDEGKVIGVEFLCPCKISIQK